ncbi:hypothetical protein ASE01_20595 [Nocardioides sp. Root190]|uniref:hypothetical protein n=1 Tax=Nocardioides sp. Root190 TaxID=1736488 RepID=UPI0006FDC026|nr:hypothetical protein [Nocardioides sp. Root190]KRB73165.1 hypothetical protein ASE01_20595 [Nocardioides sp. Root190]
MNTTVYTGRATNWFSVVISGLLLIPLLGMGLSSGSSPSLGALILAVALVGFLAEVITASDVRATCGPRGVAVNWGFLGWPRARYALDDIQDAWVVDIPWHSVSYGFWWTPTRTVCTVRRGPALRLQLLSGRTVTITVPDPRAALAALEANRAEVG